MITDYLDSIAVGDRHVSPGRTITETDLVSFAMFSGDANQCGQEALVAPLKLLVARRPG